MNTLLTLPGAWSLNEFLTNATSNVKSLGGLFLVLCGTVAIIWAGYKVIKKIITSNDQDSWGKPIAGLIVGGALMIGGFSIVETVGSGGEQTIRDFGGGTILPALTALGF